MSPEVRVHVRLGPVKIDFEGDQSFYESHVEGLVASAAARGAAGARLSAAAAPVASASAAVEAADAPAPRVPSAPAPGPGPAAAPAPAVFVPQSPEFGRYIKRLGPEAGEPDRQVVALAFYLWNYERREVFGRDEIAGCFKAIGLSPPEGLDAILVDLTDRKRFLEAVEEGTWRLSKKGENYVKTRLLSA